MQPGQRAIYFGYCFGWYHFWAARRKIPLH